jgi:hypothetical protein
MVEKAILTIGDQQIELPVIHELKVTEGLFFGLKGCSPFMINQRGR